MAFRDTILPAVVLVAFMPLLVTMPVGIPAMLAGFRRSKGRWPLLMGTIIFLSVAEASIVPRLIGMRGFVSRAAAILNLSVAATVLANFYWLRIEGMQMVRCDVAAQIENTNDPTIA